MANLNLTVKQAHALLRFVNREPLSDAEKAFLEKARLKLMAYHQYLVNKMRGNNE